MRDTGDIDTAGGNIGRDQNLERAAAETIQRLLAAILGEVTLERGGLLPELCELLAEPFRAVLGAGEDQDRIRIGVAQQLD